MSGYQNLHDEEEYVPTDSTPQQEEQQQQLPPPVADQTQEEQEQPSSNNFQQQQHANQPQQQHANQPQQQHANQPQQQQMYYVVPMLGPNGQTQLTYVPQVYYPNLIAQQQQYLQQQYMQPPQDHQQQLPPLPNVNQQPPQQQPQLQPPYIQATPANYATPNNFNNGSSSIQVTDESYVKVQGVEPLLVLLCNFFFPGLGHLIIGQQSKGAVYLAASLVSGTIIGILCVFFIGIPLVPLQILYNILILIDGYVMADRIQKGYPVLKGECYFKITSWGVSCVESKSPVFVHGSGNEPDVWQLQCRQVDRQRNL